MSGSSFTTAEADAFIRSRAFWSFGFRNSYLVENLYSVSVILPMSREWSDLWNPRPSMRTTMDVLGSRAVGRSKARTYSYLRVHRGSAGPIIVKEFYELWISHEMHCWEINIAWCAVREREFSKFGGESSGFYPWSGWSEERITLKQQSTMMSFISFIRLQFNCMRERDMLGSLLVLLQDPWLFSTDHPSAKCMPLTPCYGAFASEPVLPNINLKRTFAPCKWSEILLECCRLSKVVINDSIRATLFERYYLCGEEGLAVSSKSASLLRIGDWTKRHSSTASAAEWCSKYSSTPQKGARHA